MRSLCFHNSKEQADIDRTEIANATAILEEHLRKQNYDTNARPGSGTGNAIDGVTLKDEVRDLTQNTTVTAARTPQKNRCARAL